ncbi:hypothetical protein Tco_1508285 [Tanacetum coccineum]
MYDSWKSRMELYMMNRQHGRMILESIENSPLIWPTIEENRVTRPKKYSELSATEAIQADCDCSSKVTIPLMPSNIMILDFHISWVITFVIYTNNQLRNSSNLGNKLPLMMEEMTLNQFRETKFHFCLGTTLRLHSEEEASGRNAGKQSSDALAEEQGLTVTALKDELRKLKRKDLPNNVVCKHTIDPEMLKIDVEFISPRLLNNMSAHSDYLKHTQEEAEFLFIIGQTCPSINNSSGVKSSTSASGSQPSGNTKKDKIQRTPRNANVQQSKLNVNSELLCVKCNGCMLYDNHDLCVLDFINDVNAHTKSKSTFTIVGNVCPLTRITTTAEVPLRKLTALESDTPKPVVTLVYSRKPKKSNTNVPVSKPKIIKSISANKKEPSKSWGSIVSNVPSSSLDECKSSKLFFGIWTLVAPNI